MGCAAIGEKSAVMKMGAEQWVYFMGVFNVGTCIDFLPLGRLRWDGEKLFWGMST